MLRFRSARFILTASLALTGVSLLQPNRACAQTPASDTARATELFKQGKAAFAKGDLPEAERLFGQALALRKSSDIAANLGQSELEQQKFRSAAEHFSWALANLVPSATDAQRKAVEGGLAKARAEVAILRLAIEPAGADVLVGDQALGKAPIAGGVFVDPGEVIISVKREGYVGIDKRVMVAKGTEQAVEVTLVAKEAAPVPVAPVEAQPNQPAANAQPAAGERRSLVPAFIATGVTVASGVVGLVFTFSANSKEKDADELRDSLGAGACSEGGSASSEQCADLQSQRDSVDSSRNVALGAFVVCGVAALTAGGLYWYALSHSEPEHAARRETPFRGLRPLLDVQRADATGSLESVKLGVAGSF